MIRKTRRQIRITLLLATLKCEMFHAPGTYWPCNEENVSLAKNGNRVSPAANSASIRPKSSPLERLAEQHHLASSDADMAPEDIVCHVFERKNKSFYLSRYPSFYQTHIKANPLKQVLIFLPLSAFLTNPHESESTKTSPFLSPTIHLSTKPT